MNLGTVEFETCGAGLHTHSSITIEVKSGNVSPPADVEIGEIVERDGFVFADVISTCPS